MLQPESSPGSSRDIFVVIVLYGMAVEDSPAYRGLHEFLALHGGFEVLLFDNTPGSPLPADLPAHFHYVASRVNSGLATAYNLAAELAEHRGCRWLLTLDQDSVLPPDFLSEFTKLASVYQNDSHIAAIVPHILAGERTVSPNWFVRNTWPRWFPRGYCGVPKEAVYAFNSGTLVRLDALRKIGGYSPLFWLDNCDHYLFRRFEVRGLAIYIAGNVEIQHDFSMLNVSEKMSPARYRNALEAGSAFSDMEFDWREGLEHTALLLRRYLRLTVDKQPREIRDLTARMIRLRLLHSKSQRIQDWERAQQERIRGYGDTGGIAVHANNDQKDGEEEVRKGNDASGKVVSVLAIVVLYKTSLEASSTLTTLRVSKEQAPGKLRFRTLVYDNSPSAQAALSLPDDVTYIADPTNPGLAKPYNVATAIAKQDGFDWVLTLDQDTELRPDFLCRLTDIVASIQGRADVAAVLPRVMEGERILSPNWFALDFFARHFPSGFNGVANQSGYGFNSATTVRVSALQAIGGYSPLFPLDYSDAYLFRKLHIRKYKTYVAGDLVVDHHLSILHVGEMSLERYRNVMKSGSMFCDLMRNKLVGAQFTYRLVRGYLGLLVRSKREDKKTILADLLLHRLLTRRSTRIRLLAEDEKTKEAIRVAQT